MASSRCTLVLSLSLAACLFTGQARADAPALKVAVFENAPPLAYRDSTGKLTGFTTSIARAMCADLGVRCEFEVTQLDSLVERVAAGYFDVAAVGLLNTPERSQKVLFTRPVYRSITLWFARPGVQPGDQGTRVSTFRGSAHENYAKARHWDAIGAQNDVQMIEQLAAGVAHAAIAPLMTSISLQQHPIFKQLGLKATVLQLPELAGNASFAINPRRADLKDALDRALENIKRNGAYDRINSEFLPFRVE